MCFLISAFIVPDVPNVSIFTLCEEIFLIDFKSLIVFSFSTWLHLTIPFSPSNLIKDMPESLQSLLKRCLHCNLISWLISFFLICNCFVDVLIIKPMYLRRLPSLIIFYTSKICFLFWFNTRCKEIYYMSFLFGNVKLNFDWIVDNNHYCDWVFSSYRFYHVAEIIYWK